MPWYAPRSGYHLAMAEFIPTEEQGKILEHNYRSDGVILAGPGTGKSATVVALVERLSKLTKPPKMRLLTFTRAATAELAKNVSSHPTLAALSPSTIHSFAISVLLRNKGAGDFPEPLRMADGWETRYIVRPSLARHMNIDVRMVKRLITELESNWQALTPEHNVKVDPQVRARFLGFWDEHRRIYGYTMLAELPDLLRRALESHSDLKGLDLDLLIVDEYQDLNACDLEVLEKISERGCSLLAAGDDDQSIYSFRKAAPEGIRRFPNDYPGSEDYPLTVTKRCGKKIVQWANFVIDGDPGRPADHQRVQPDRDAPDGEVALLAFDDNGQEADGIAKLIRKLIEVDGIPASEILVLFRGDHNQMFTKPVKELLTAMGVPISDPDVVSRALDEEQNRRTLETLRVAVRREDSLAWASLLQLTDKVGERFHDYVYEHAKAQRTTFAQALLRLHDGQFPSAPKASARHVKRMVDSVLDWIDENPLPEPEKVSGWGRWLSRINGGPVVPGFTSELAQIVGQLDGMVDTKIDLGRFLSQVEPLGSDLATARSEGVRFMTMGGSKGLTVQAVIVSAVEEGIVPRPDADLSEERRLLYVALTRARKQVFCTWARKRYGPTARSGTASVGTRRQYSAFLRNGPVRTQEGNEYLER